MGAGGGGPEVADETGCQFGRAGQRIGAAACNADCAGTVHTCAREIEIEIEIGRCVCVSVKSDPTLCSVKSSVPIIMVSQDLSSLPSAYNVLEYQPFRKLMDHHRSYATEICSILTNTHHTRLLFALCCPSLCCLSLCCSVARSGFSTCAMKCAWGK